MIRVRKDLINTPRTLTRGSTVSKRNGAIANAIYPRANTTSSNDQKKKVKEYDSRFKQSDIKSSLKSTYNKKCAYCEQKVVSGSEAVENKSTIEHYRPKSIYYWLAYSWDNLLWCCHRCNQNKSNNFDIVNTQVIYTTTFLSKIHSCTKIYNRIEKPKFIHPEFENVRDLCKFDVNGVIDSEDVRVKYTITECGIDRDDLNEKRKKILDILKEKVNDRRLQGSSYKDIIENFISSMKNQDSEFIAFRYWVLNNIQSLV